MARRLSDLVSRSDAFASWAERLGRWGTAFGISGWIAGSIWTVLSATGFAVMWFVHTVPWWATVLIALAFGSLSLQVYVKARTAWAIRGVRTLDLANLGKDCITLKAEVFDFLVSRLDSAPSRAGDHATSDLEITHRTMEAVWARGVAYDTQTRGRAMQRFAARIIAICHLLQGAGISPPSLWNLNHNIENVSAHLGAIGELLERGLLNEARDFNPQQIRHLNIRLS